MDKHFQDFPFDPRIQLIPTLEKEICDLNLVLQQESHLRCNLRKKAAEELRTKLAKQQTKYEDVIRDLKNEHTVALEDMKEKSNEEKCQVRLLYEAKIAKVRDEKRYVEDTFAVYKRQVQDELSKDWDDKLDQLNKQNVHNIDEAVDQLREKLEKEHEADTTKLQTEFSHLIKDLQDAHELQIQKMKTELLGAQCERDDYLYQMNEMSKLLEHTQMQINFLKDPTSPKEQSGCSEDDDGGRGDCDQCGGRYVDGSGRCDGCPGSLSETPKPRTVIVSKGKIILSGDKSVKTAPTTVKTTSKIKDKFSGIKISTKPPYKKNPMSVDMKIQNLHIS